MKFPHAFACIRNVFQNNEHQSSFSHAPNNNEKRARHTLTTSAETDWPDCSKERCKFHVHHALRPTDVRKHFGSSNVPLALVRIRTEPRATRQQNTDTNHTYGTRVCMVDVCASYFICSLPTVCGCAWLALHFQ